MLYKMITNARDRWYQSEHCTIREIIGYIETSGHLRDAQVEAIKTYLFLKIGCDNKSLYQLVIAGAFNSLNLDSLEVSTAVRKFLLLHPEAAAFYEYVTLKNDKDEQISHRVEELIREKPETIDYLKVWNDIFYGVSYTDYLFSLPMGAGKTFLMAAFIYLDLYFALNEPENPIFAHNFIIFAPSGLKSSVVPSLRTIQNFDPRWVIPDPSASDIKCMIMFEVLDQAKTAKKSNKTKNPNVQKISIHQPLQDLFGLIAVTNAEKVILDRVEEKNGQISMFEDSEDEQDRQANELRNLIGKLPSLSVFIDEVHHAVKDEVKLRAVVNKWMQGGTVNNVIGFSGTPYLEKAEKISITEKLNIASIEISNIVYYYPLINGIGNFLKHPSVKIMENASSAEIVEAGIQQFLNTYKDTVYENGLTAKLAIYCGRIEKLNTQIYPIAERIVTEYGLNPTDSILSFYEDAPSEAYLEYASLDKPFSKVRIVLLVQIGKEGWDCRSLTGIVLSQEGDCPPNMVLQTSCRCLRQVIKGRPETALIYLNSANGEKLNLQLEQQHHISIKEFETGKRSELTDIKRYDRTDYLKLPSVDFYQLRIQYRTLVIANQPPTDRAISEAISDDSHATIVVKAQDFEGNATEGVVTEDVKYNDGHVIANFNSWLNAIAKESFGFVNMPKLKPHEPLLRRIFDAITYDNGGVLCFNPKYLVAIINANIRKAFYEKRTFESIEELIPEKARLLRVENLHSPVQTTTPEAFYPDQKTTENIILEDKGKLKQDPKILDTIRMLDELGQHEMANSLRKQLASHPMKNSSFHYVPYKTDSNFEQIFLAEALSLQCVRDKHLEVYYNGDRTLTEFKIRCFKKSGTKWNYIGKYTPDFLIIQRKMGKIYKAIIAETKGRIYANDTTFVDKRKFVETEFTVKNNEKYGYKRFQYLYLEDTLSEHDQIALMAGAVNTFFGDN